MSDGGQEKMSKMTLEYGQESEEHEPIEELLITIF